MVEEGNMCMAEHMPRDVFNYDGVKHLWDSEFRCGVDGAWAPGFTTATVSQSLEISAGPRGLGLL